ncbi:MAG: hypothetical protein VXZ87_03925 [Bacteroidota bacterium]|nr:hypothetical protein [Bacteroidota bacterium]
MTSWVYEQFTSSQILKAKITSAEANIKKLIQQRSNLDENIEYDQCCMLDSEIGKARVTIMQCHEELMLYPYEDRNAKIITTKDLF